MFHPRVFFGRGANRFSRSFAAPMGRPSPEVLIYLRVLVMVTVVAEATGREFILLTSDTLCLKHVFRALLPDLCGLAIYDGEHSNQTQTSVPTCSMVMDQ